jgi:hypothetical protein
VASLAKYDTEKAGAGGGGPTFKGYTYIGPDPFNLTLTTGNPVALSPSGVTILMTSASAPSPTTSQALQPLGWTFADMLSFPNMASARIDTGLKPRAWIEARATGGPRGTAQRVDPGELVLGVYSDDAGLVPIVEYRVTVV